MEFQRHTSKILCRRIAVNNYLIARTNLRISSLVGKHIFLANLKCFAELAVSQAAIFQVQQRSFTIKCQGEAREKRRAKGVQLEIPQGVPLGLTCRIDHSDNFLSKTFMLGPNFGTSWKTRRDLVEPFLRWILSLRLIGFLRFFMPQGNNFLLRFFLGRVRFVKMKSENVDAGKVERYRGKRTIWYCFR